MTTEQFDQAVVHVEWAKAAIDDDGTKAAVFRSSDFDPKKITGHFVPFSELTEELVLSWITQDAKSIKSVDDALMEEMEKQRRAKAVQAVNLPWVST